MTRLVTSLVASFVVCLSLSLRAAQTPARPDTSAKAVALAAEHYVDDYQKQLSYLLAEEDGTQDVFESGLPSGPPRQRRTTKAEIFLTFLEADRVWLAVRDVTEVDGQPLALKKDLRAMLTAGPILGLARTLAFESSRFNIGRIARNFNEPTIGLLVLDEKHRANFKFDRKKVESSEAGPIVTLAFTEKGAPTLIHGGNGADIISRGELIVEAATGRVRQTMLEIATGAIRAKLTTTFVEDKRLEIWVPDTLTERYTDQVDTRHPYETTVCQSKYTNYRRFDVQVRIK